MKAFQFLFYFYFLAFLRTYNRESKSDYTCFNAIVASLLYSVFLFFNVWTVLNVLGCGKPALYVAGTGSSWINRIKKYSIDSTLHIFIFQTDKITDELIKNREYERLSFKVKELDSLNWTVVYSGKNKTKEGAR